MNKTSRIKELEAQLMKSNSEREFDRRMSRGDDICCRERIERFKSALRDAAPIAVRVWDLFVGRGCDYCFENMFYEVIHLVGDEVLLAEYVEVRGTLVRQDNLSCAVLYLFVEKQIASKDQRAYFETLKKGDSR